MCLYIFQVPSPWSDAAFAQSMMSSPPQSEAVAQPQSCAAVAAVPAAVQLPIELNLAEAVAPTGWSGTRVYRVHNTMLHSTS